MRWKTGRNGTLRTWLARATVCGAIAGSMLMRTGPARGQAMDYGALENMFGEPVTTSVTGSPQRASDVPAPMIIVTQDEIRRSGARDIPGVLRHVPGVGVLQWTGGNADVGIRGYDQSYSTRLLVLVDGRQVYADSFGYTPWSTLPVELSDIRQIEIVMGPSSALYGFNAVSGVINIITFDPLYDDVNTGSLSAGTQGTLQGSAIATLKLADDAGIRISLGGHRDDDFATPTGPLNGGTPRSNDRVAIDILGHARVGHDIDVSLELSHSETHGPEMTPIYTINYGKYRANAVKASITADTSIGILQATVYDNWLGITTTTTHSAIVPALQFGSSVLVAKLRHIFKLGSEHTFRLSAEYRNNAMDTTTLALGNVHYDVFAGGAMWSWQILPNLSVTNAVRVDHLSLGRSGTFPPGFGLTNAAWNRHALTEVSFNSGVVWKPDKNDTIRFTLARGIQLPNLMELGGLLVQTPFGYASGIPTLNPSILMNYEIDWDHNILNWNAHFRIQIFHQTSKDIVSLFGQPRFPLGIVLGSANIGGSEATGAELSLQGVFASHWRWGVSYTPEVIIDHLTAGFSFVDTVIDYQHTNPVHVANVNLGWARGPWEIDGYLRYQSSFGGIRGANASFPVGTLVHISDYVSVDARLAYQVNDHLTLAVSGQNLLESPQIQTSGPAVERRVLVSLTGHL